MGYILSLKLGVRPGELVAKADDPSFPFGFRPIFKARTVSYTKGIPQKTNMESNRWKFWSFQKKTPPKVSRNPLLKMYSYYWRGSDVLLMIPIYRDEIGDDSWEALELLAAFLRLLGFNATAYLKQIWAVGYYDNNRKCPRERAQYCHGFVKVPDARHLELLKLSGTKGFYSSSRSVERTADLRYRVIWLDRLSHEAMLQLRATVEHAGLVPAKGGLPFPPLNRFPQAIPQHQEMLSQIFFILPLSLGQPPVGNSPKR